MRGKPAGTLCLLLLFLLEAQARHGHHWRDRHRERAQRQEGESTREVHPRGRYSRRHSDLPPWLSRLHGLLNGDNFASEFFNPYRSLTSHYGRRMEPWWEGPNICPRETEKITNVTESVGEIRRHFTSRVQFCDESDTSYRCRMVEEDDGGRKETSVIYECCHGFSRVKGDFGCPQEKKLLPLLQTAQNLGLRDFVRAVKLLQLSQEIQSGNFTVFAPVDGTFGIRRNLRDFESGIMLQDMPRDLVVTETGVEHTVQTLQGALLGHMVPGLHRTSALHDEDVLQSESPQGTTLRINYFEGPEKLMTVNCIRVVSRDHMTTNGVIHTIEDAIKPVSKTLLEFVRSRRELTMLKTVLAKAEYVYELDADAQITLLAPSDMAFRQMDKRLRERLLRGDRKCLERVLHSHILPNVICSSAIQGQARTPNLMRKYINITRTEDDKLFVENAQIVERDVMATNGVMHVIDEVLVPDETLGVLQLLERKGFSELLKLVYAARLTETLDTISNVTILAPTNDAIQALPEAWKSRFSSDPDLLRKILLFHISPGENNCQHFHDNKLIPSSEGRQIRLNRNTNFMYPQFDAGTAQCAPMHGPTLVACNGKVQVISEVMMPPAGNLVDVMAKDKRFSTLLSLIKKADLVDKLQETGPFTIFAPNNEGFENADKRTLDLLTRDTTRLLNLLKGHVFDGFLCCARINRGWVFSFPRMYTLAGNSLRMTRDVSGKPKVGNAYVVKCDRTATNGNVLEIDRVLLEQPRPRHWGNRWRRWRYRWA